MRPTTTRNDGRSLDTAGSERGTVMMRKSTATVLAACLLAWVLPTAPATAKSTYLISFEAAYPAAVGSRIDTCSLCHTSVPALNGYGNAYKLANHSYPAIQDLDSDLDTYSNIAEIRALTFPGIASDRPVLPPVDAQAPQVILFDLPETASALDVGVVSLAATDNIGVTGYLLSESAAKPPASDPAWSATSPGNYTFPEAGTRILYAYARDAAGNVSEGVSDTVLITLEPPPPPPPLETLIFRDAFDDANLAGDSNWTNMTGTFGGVKEAFTALGRGRNLALVADVPALDPFAGGRIETKVRIGSADVKMSAEIVFDYLDAENYRYVRLDRNRKRLVIGQAGTFGEVIEEDDAAVPDTTIALSRKLRKVFSRPDRWQHLRIDVDPVAGSVSVYLNHAEVPAVTGSILQTGVGRVGLAARKASRVVAFDNFEVNDGSVLP